MLHKRAYFPYTQFFMHIILKLYSFLSINNFKINISWTKHSHCVVVLLFWIFIRKNHVFTILQWCCRYWKIKTRVLLYYNLNKKLYWNLFQLLFHYNEWKFYFLRFSSEIFAKSKDSYTEKSIFKLIRMTWKDCKTYWKYCVIDQKIVENFSIFSIICQ